MSESPSFERVLSGVRRGDADGVAELIVRRFADRLVALAARRISERLRRRVEAEDVVQSVFRTFFRRLDDGLMELRDWESLWGLLARIAVCRICRHAEHNAAARRNQNREVDWTADAQPFDRDPATEEVLIAEDLHACLVDAMPKQYRPILLRILDGGTHEEIARELGTSISTVERVHRRARDRLAALLAAETG
jgi:RNA polymerase sigma-70 factor (ECF subfamily)